MSLLIKNGTVVTEGGMQRANILIRGRRIAALTSSEPNSDRVIDAEGMLVIPGVVDPHVHFRQPGMEGEDWVTGSMSALAGGVTTVLDMPNTRPPATTKALLEEKQQLVELQTASSALVNYGFHFGATSSNVGEISAVGLGSAEGEVSGGGRRIAASVKVFMGSSTGDLLVEDPSALRGILGASRLTTVHAEDEAVIRERCDQPDHLSRRPKEAALSAIRKLLQCRGRGGVYVCHLTSAEEIQLAEQFYREATPHHLFLTDDLMKKIGNFAKVNPPLRSESDRRSLWESLLEGRIDCIGSDHAPHTRLSKEGASGAVPSGMPGVETSLPLLLDRSLRGEIALERVISMMCLNPASIFGLRGKGRIAPGYDADIVLIDPKEERTVRADRLHYKCGWTPYEGLRLRGWPKITILNGAEAYVDGVFTKARGGHVKYAF
ncbi:MAG: dihydroorotase [Candidatus Methanomethylicia archaeon]|nr:dihydroorotase [Candidatus Methanomethylicia archaeon]